MQNEPLRNLPQQTFQDAERLLRRVRFNNLRRDGRATPLAFELPDMSVNRDRHSTDEEARGGLDACDWGVVAFRVDDIPPRKLLAHNTQTYNLAPRHVPLPKNFAHTEVRIWRVDDGIVVLITDRQHHEFDPYDIDRDASRAKPSEMLDPDFHMRWRKRISLASKLVLPPSATPAERQSS